MSGRVRLDLAGPFGVVTFDRADSRVNTFDSVAIAELEHLLDVLESRRDLRGVILRSAKPGHFLSGADLEELARMESALQASFWLQRAQAVLRRIERLAVPSVAEIGGAALGGGLEVALACTYRVTTDASAVRLGLPEVQLGLCPAAGGTWRLPARVGPRVGLDLLLTGRRLTAGEALRIGLLDEVVPPAALTAAGERLLAERPRPRRGGSWLERRLLGNPAGWWLAADRARVEIRRKTGDRFAAPFAILHAASCGRRGGGRRAEAAERREFGPLALSSASKHLVELFFATRAARPREPSPPLRIGVLGGGLMGGGIALSALRAGHVVRVFDLRPEALGRLLAEAARSAARSRRRGRWSPAQERAARNRLQVTTRPLGFSTCDLVIEAVFEELEVKRRLFEQVASTLADGALVASNTSTLPIERLADGLPHPERVIGLHFFSPVTKMPLVEIVRHGGNSADVVDRARAFVGSLGKTPIVVRDGPGFYTTRVVGALTGEAIRLVSEGASVAEVERAGRAAGFPVGPLTLLDEVGLDVAAHAAETLHAAFPQRFADPTPLAALVERGHLGRKSGLGFFDWRRHKRPNVAIELPAARQLERGPSAQPGRLGTPADGAGRRSGAMPRREHRGGAGRRRPGSGARARLSPGDRRTVPAARLDGRRERGRRARAPRRVGRWGVSPAATAARSRGTERLLLFMTSNRFEEDFG